MERKFGVGQTWVWISFFIYIYIFVSLDEILQGWFVYLENIMVKIRWIYKYVFRAHVEKWEGGEKQI